MIDDRGGLGTGCEQGVLEGLLKRLGSRLDIQLLADGRTYIGGQAQGHKLCRVAPERHKRRGVVTEKCRAVVVPNGIGKHVLRESGERRTDFVRSGRPVAGRAQKGVGGYILCIAHDRLLDLGVECGGDGVFTAARNSTAAIS